MTDDTHQNPSEDSDSAPELLEGDKMRPLPLRGAGRSPSPTNTRTTGSTKGRAIDTFGGAQGDSLSKASDAEDENGSDFMRQQTPQSEASCSSSTPQTPDLDRQEAGDTLPSPATITTESEPEDDSVPLGSSPDVLHTGDSTTESLSQTSAPLESPRAVDEPRESEPLDSWGEPMQVMSSHISGYGHPGSGDNGPFVAPEGVPVPSLTSMEGEYSTAHAPTESNQTIGIASSQGTTPEINTPESEQEDEKRSDPIQDLSSQEGVRLTGLDSVTATESSDSDGQESAGATMDLPLVSGSMEGEDGSDPSLPSTMSSEQERHSSTSGISTRDTTSTNERGLSSIHEEATSASELEDDLPEYPFAQGGESEATPPTSPSASSSPENDATDAATRVPAHSAGEECPDPQPCGESEDLNSPQNSTATDISLQTTGLQRRNSEHVDSESLEGENGSDPIYTSESEGHAGIEETLTDTSPGINTTISPTGSSGSGDVGDALAGAVIGHAGRYLNQMEIAEAEGSTVPLTFGSSY